MFRTPLIAALTVALLGTTAMAQPASAPPAVLSNSARNAPDLDNEEGLGSPPSDAQDVYAQRDADARAREDARTRDSRAAAMDREVFCRRDAAARTGYTTPGEAARSEQTRGTVGGTMGGAA